MNRLFKTNITIIVFLILWFINLNGQCQLGTVLNYQKISDTQGNFTGALSNYYFGTSIAGLEDFDGDGTKDIVVGHLNYDLSPVFLGKIWILFLNPNGTVKSYQYIDTPDHSRFGISVASLGDLDGDGITDIAVGACADGDGGAYNGAVWILFLNSNGTVKSRQKISATQGSFTGILSGGPQFGYDVDTIGDLDGDGIVDIAVGSLVDDDGGTDRGAVWILFLNSDGTVKSHQKISDTQGNFTGVLDNSDVFGSSVSSLGDLDGDGVPDIAVGARNDDDGGTDRGAIWILFLNSNGTVKSYQKISDTQGGFNGILDNSDNFGVSVSLLGDLSCDGIKDIAVGSFYDDDGGTDKGAIYELFLNTNGTVKSYQKINDTQGNFGGILDNGDRFGRGVGCIGDINNDGSIEIGVGADFDDDGGSNMGAVWILSLYSPNSGPVINSHPLSQTICESDSVVFNISATGADTITYQWYFNGNAIVGATDSSYTINSASMSDTGNYYCIAINPCGEDTSNIAVLTVDSVVADAGSDISVCSGNVDTLTATGAGVGGSYLWSTGSTNDTTIVSPTITTTYIVTVTDINNCSDTDEIIIIVNTAYNITASVSICQGDSVLLQGTYQTTTGIYNDTLLSSGGCDSTIVTTLIVNSVYINYDTITICQGDSILLEGIYQFTTGVYYDTLTTANSCDSIIETTLTVNPKPTANLTGDTIICNRDSTSLTASGVGTYLWSTTDTTSTITIYPTTTSTYTVTVTNSYNCTATSEITVTVNPVPNKPDVMDKELCTYTHESTLTVNNPNPTYQYYWYNSIGDTALAGCNNTNCSSIDINNITVPDTFYIRCVNAAGCYSLYDTVYVTEAAMPVAEFSIETTPPYYEGQQLQFTDESTNGYSWVWFFGDDNYSSDRNPKHRYTTEGLYWVQLIVCTQGLPVCCDTLRKDNYIQIIKKAQIYVPSTFTPNGDNKNDKLYVKGEGILNLNFKIYNQWGIKIFETKNQLEGWDGKYNGQEQPEGNYIYLLEATTIDEQNATQQGVISIVR